MADKKSGPPSGESEKSRPSKTAPPPEHYDDVGSYLTTTTGPPPEDVGTYLTTTAGPPPEEPPIYEDVEGNNYESLQEPPEYSYVDPVTQRDNYQHLSPQERHQQQQHHPNNQQQHRDAQHTAPPYHSTQPQTPTGQSNPAFVHGQHAPQPQTPTGQSNPAFVHGQHAPSGTPWNQNVVQTQPQSMGNQVIQPGTTTQMTIPYGAQVVTIPGANPSQGHTITIIQQEAQPKASMVGHIVFSCVVFWCCNCLFGAIAFFVAIAGLDSSKEKGKSLGKISLGLNVTGIIVTVLIIAISLGVGLSRQAAYSAAFSTTTTRSYYE